MSVWLLLFACRSEDPASTPPPSPTPELEACLADGVEVDCGQVDPCVRDLELQLACCTCDAAFCAPMVCVPEELPPDVGPALDFARPLQAVIPALHEDDVAVGVMVTPDLVLVGDDPLQAVQMVCSRAGNTFTCDEAYLTVGGTTRLRAWELQIQLADGDGDGVADGGLARVVGTLSVPGPVPSDVAAIVELQQDMTAGDAVLPIGALPTRPVVVRLPELVAGSTSLRVDGEVRALEAVAGVGGVGALRDLPGAPVLPWGAELTLDPGLVDLSGNPLGAVGGSVVADPGPFTDDLGFEGPGGWAAVGFGVPDLSLPYPDLPVPAEGLAYQHTWAGGVLVGDAVLPVDASTLGFQVAVTGARTQPDAQLTVVEADGTRTVVWTFDPTPLAPCGTATCMPWTEVTLDISPWAGARVWLELQAGPAGSLAAIPAPAPPSIGLSVDAFTLD